MSARITASQRSPLALATLFLLVAGLLAQPARAAAGFVIDDGRLVDANGNDFVMRGVSHAHTWFSDQTGAFADIKSLGANTVRVVLSSGDRSRSTTPPGSARKARPSRLTR
jgi:mannan endo-1,4-beta-mannosidase